MANNTKEKILNTALEMIAEKGYAGMNIRELSSSLGLSKAAMYRHFESKEALFDALCEYMGEYYGGAGAMSETKIPDDCGGLLEMTMNMVSFTVNDKKIVMMRKILLTEQFRSEKVRRLANEYFLDGMTARFARIFEGMMKNGSIRPGDPGMLALEYSSPITGLIHLADRDPSRKNEAVDGIRSFISHFIEIHKAPAAVLETPRLVLRQMDRSDFDALYAVLADSDIMKHYPQTFDSSRVMGWIDRNTERYAVFGFGLWAVCLKQTGEVIGDCGLTMQNINGFIRPEIGYHIRKASQRQGYAKEAAGAVRDWAFANTTFNELFAYMQKENIASSNTAKSIGMTFRGEYHDEANGITEYYSIKKENDKP